MITYQGPDISTHNGNVDIKRVRDAGYKRVGIRAGFGKNNTDQKYSRNALACVNIGVPVILYWFSYAYTIDMAVKEAEYAVEHAKKYWDKCPIAFDLEYDSIRYARTKGVNIDKDLATKMAVAFMRRVRELGYIPVIYSNKDYLKNYFNLPYIYNAIGKTYLWYARYASAITTEERNKADIWQFTSKGTIPGINGNVDINEFYTDFETVAKEPEENSLCNIDILNFQKACNLDGYIDMNGKPLKEDGIDDLKTQYVRKQIEMKAKRVGLTWKSGYKGHVVEWFQGRCNEILGCKIKVDGFYGADTRKACLELQRKLGLKQDGIAGYNTIQAVFYN